MIAVMITYLTVCLLGFVGVGFWANDGNNVHEDWLLASIACVILWPITLWFFVGWLIAEMRKRARR